MADEKDTAVEAETTEAVATEVAVEEVASEKPAKAEKAEKPAKAEKKPYVRIVPRLQKRYRAEIKPELMKEFSFKNVHQVP